MSVLLCSEIELETLMSLLNRYGLVISHVDADEEIPGSFWKPPEAGLISNTLYLRDDTPVHSALHETCHYICMDDDRRKNLDTDAAGDYAEEDAVCYLQILLSEELPGLGRDRMFNDMDEWGYSFRLGDSRSWFESDAEDARAWLVENGLIDEEKSPTWKKRV